jgi:hypothetical protein
MILLEARWTLGVLVGIPLLVAALIIGVIWTIFAYGTEDRRQFDTSATAGFRFFGKFCGPILVLGVLIGASVGYFPYEAQYHQYQETTGIVASIDVRLVSSGDSMQEKFVVVYDDGRERGCLDTRCAAVQPGDILTMECKRIYQWSGTDGWDCNFVSRTPARE